MFICMITLWVGKVVYYFFIYVLHILLPTVLTVFYKKNKQKSSSSMDWAIGFELGFKISVRGLYAPQKCLLETPLI